MELNPNNVEQPEETEPIAVTLPEALDETPPAAEPELEVTRSEVAADVQRVFKVGTTSIVQDDSMIGKSNEQIQSMLAAMYPEVKHATIRERKQDGIQVVEFLPQAGRKG